MKGKHLPNPGKKHLYFEEIKIRLETGMTLVEAAEPFDVNYTKVYQWFKDENIPIPKANKLRPRIKIVERNCDYCDEYYLPSHSKSRFCSRGCTNQWQRENKARFADKICKCGNEFHPRTNQQLYCSKPCAEKYQGRRQRDPENYVTFNCQTCDKEVTRYKKYGNGANKYCSNECAAKDTQKVRHYVLTDLDMVLKGSWETLFAGLMTFLKIDIKQFDRDNVVEFEDENSKINRYGPDFIIKIDDIDYYIEVKGYPQSHHIPRWEAFRKKYDNLIVIDFDIMNRILIAAPNRNSVIKIITTIKDK